MNEYDKILEAMKGMGPEFNELREGIESLIKENEDLKKRLKINNERLEQQLSKIDKIFDVESFSIEDESLIPSQLDYRLELWAREIRSAVIAGKKTAVEGFKNEKFDVFHLMDLLGFGTCYQPENQCKYLALCFVLIEHSGICIEYAKSEDVRRGKQPMRWYKVLLDKLKLYRENVNFKD